MGQDLWQGIALHKATTNQHISLWLIFGLHAFFQFHSDYFLDPFYILIRNGVYLYYSLVLFQLGISDIFLSSWV